LSVIAPILERYARKISTLTARLGRRVRIGELGITDRAGELPLGPPGGLVSPNGACRMFRAADGWVALNLASEEDRDLVPAWLECDHGGDAWALVEAHAAAIAADTLRDRAILLGLPACRVGEVAWADPEPTFIARRGFGAARPRESPQVVDLSALWAGPLCGAVLAAMGCEVTKVESVRRPDPTRLATPDFYRRLNGQKAHLALDLKAPEAQARLRDMVLDADVVITSARLRGLQGIGLDPDSLIAQQPRLRWVAITGYGVGWGREGWDHPWAQRVAFGDDAAAAGGLVYWTRDGQPRFAGDALSDPVSGLAAALGALEALTRDSAVIVDVGMALRSARAAATLGERLAV
jgi:hypothetical protein